jgi:MFS family permease
MSSDTTAALQRTTLRVLVVSNVLGGVGVASGITVTGLLGEAISDSTSMSGLAVTATTVGAALLAVPLARVAQARGRRPALTIGYLSALLGAVLSIVAAVADSMILLLVASCLFGGGTAANLQARYAAVDAAEPRHRARALSVVVWATTVGVILGPNLTGVGGRAGEAVGIPALSGPFLFSTVAFVFSVAAVWIGLLPLHRARAAQPPAAVERKSLAATFRQVVSIPPARLGLVAIAVAHAVMVGIMSMTSVHLRHHGASLTVVGFVISGHVAGMFALSPLMGWLTDRFGRFRTIHLGLTVLALSTVVAAAAPDHAHGMTGIALALLGLGWSACLVAGSTLLSESVPGDIRTAAQGMSDLTMGVLASIAGTASGPILDHYGFDRLSIVYGLLLVPAAVLALVTRRPRDPVPAQGPDGDGSGVARST